MASYKIDVDHSDITFRVKHLMISTATGYFKKFDATVETEGEDFTNAKVYFEADIDSIDTKNAQRDATQDGGVQLGGAGALDLAGVAGVADGDARGRRLAAAVAVIARGGAGLGGQEAAALGGGGRVGRGRAHRRALPA